MDTLTVAKTVVLNKAGKILLLRRSKTDPRRPGEWDFPGGQIEPGEDLIHGAVRELKEEAGIKAAIGELKLAYAGTIAYEDRSVTRLLFVAHVEAASVNLSNEHDDYHWVDIETAFDEFPHPFYAVGLKYARDHGLL